VIDRRRGRAGALAGACLATVVIGAPPAAAGKADPANVRPLILPGDARAAALRHTGSSWIVGGRPGADTASLAARHGASPVIAESGIYVLPIDQARPFAAALQAAGRLWLAEPDVLARKLEHPRDPLSPAQWWLDPVVDRFMTPPPLAGDSPVLGMVEEQIDLQHREMQGGGIVSTSSVNDPPDAHGTQVAGAAGAPANGFGIVGIWPGMRILLPVYRGTTCANFSRTVNRAAAARHVRVINMSYGFEPAGCFSHFVATEKAFGHGIALVAAGGNEYQEGNPQERPATDPHVITVAGLNPNLTSYAHSNENGAIDLSAPATNLLLPTPPQFDRQDGSRDGFERVSGTSFAAPMVAAVATWLVAVRPALLPGQIQDILNASASDLGRRGYDQTFGWGKVNLRRALSVPAPGADPHEPNDDIDWVNGSHRTGAAIFGPSTRTRSVTARLHGFEDPFDVYRVVIPARTSVRFRLTASSGNPGLDVYRRSARTVRSTRGLLGRSNGRGPETVVLTNRGSASVTVWANPYVNERSLARASYALQVKKIAFRG
jgi:hypothetical protein